MWDGPPATSFALEVRPYDRSPEGDLRILARVLLRAHGAPAQLRSGGDFGFSASHGDVQWQTRLRFGGPAALIRVRDTRPLTVRAVANDPRALGTQRVTIRLDGARAAGIVARALGPHAVQIGWFPASAGSVRIGRNGRTVALAGPPFTDAGVTPGGVERYAVHRAGAPVVGVRVAVPRALPRGAASTVAGKGAWLAFSGTTWDPDGYRTLDPGAIAERAAGAGLRWIALRLAYGEFWETTPEAQPTIDALIDRLATRGIAVLAWTVPRAVTFEDLATAVAAASYRTPAGNGPAGVALDLERGPEFLGTGPALAAYAARLRAALGAEPLVVGTVEDPVLEGLDERAVPYRAIAASVDVLQPMTYWRIGRAARGPAAVRRTVDAVLTRLRGFAPRTPLDLGAQTTDLGNGAGPPTAAEVGAATREARRRGALGVTYYDLPGTSPAAWSAIGAVRW